MSNVTSEPLEKGRAATTPPLSRRHLDNARRPARILFGAAFVAYSSIGTIVGVQRDLAPALASRPDAILLGYGIGFAVALVIFVAEVLLSEADRFWYTVVLLPDVWYTYHFSAWIDALIRARFDADERVLAAMSMLATALFALAVAYFGERLLFGKRRR